MTILEAVAACKADSANLKEVKGFSKSFRTDALNNIQAGESFEIPQDYVVFQQRMMRNGQQMKDSQGNPVIAEFINVLTNTNRNVRFYPTSLTKVAFEVDQKGKNLMEDGRRKAPRHAGGNLYDFVKGRDINSVMESLKGCTIECTKLNEVKVRAFGVSNEDATEKDVEKQNVGDWNLIGDVKPIGWKD